MSERTVLPYLKSLNDNVYDGFKGFSLTNPYKNSLVETRLGSHPFHNEGAERQAKQPALTATKPP